MSLYGFGKVVGGEWSELASRLIDAGESSSVVVAIGSVDDDDADVIARAECLSPPGVLFSIFAAPGATDATSLWIEAMKALQEGKSQDMGGAVLEDFLGTRLGQVCSRVLGLGEVAAVSLVDGGIEDVFEGTLESCLRRMATDVCRPWDQSPNRLYIRVRR